MKSGWASSATRPAQSTHHLRARFVGAAILPTYHAVHVDAVQREREGEAFMLANKVTKWIALFLRPRNYSRVAVVVIFLLPAPSQVRVFIHHSLAVVPLVLFIPPMRSARVHHCLGSSPVKVGQRGCKQVTGKEPTYERDY